MKKLIDSVNVSAYRDLYKTMEYDHSYPNINLVRLEKWFLKKPGYVLDHGCGYGENLIFLVSRGYKVMGVDICKDLIEYLKIKCKIRQIPPSLYSLKVLKNKGRLPFKNGTFDYIVSLGVLEMLSDRDSAMLCIKEFTRCLKMGGKMIVSTLAPENSYAVNGFSLGNESYNYKGMEPHKNISVEYNLYIPSSPESFESIFLPLCKVHEIGSWDNDYCGVKGKHYVALVSKVKKTRLK